MERLQKLLFKAKPNFFREYLSKLDRESNLFSSLGEGALLSSNKKPDGRLREVAWLNENNY